MYVDPSNPVSGTAGAAGASIAKSDDPRKHLSRVAETRLGQAYTRVLRRALQMGGRSPEEIGRLQASLEAGRYDSLEAAIQAARTMIQYGI